MSKNLFIGKAASSFVEAFLATRGVRVNYSKWKCYYCDSINTKELNCRNCGAPEKTGLRNFEGLPFKKSTFYFSGFNQNENR